MTWQGYKDQRFDDGSKETLSTFEVEFSVPPATYTYTKNNEHIREAMQRAVAAILDGRSVWLFSEYQEPEDRRVEHIEYRYVVKLLDVDEGWMEVLRSKLLSGGPTNQGKVTSILFARDNKDTLEYNEMTFASHAEIRIAQELEKRKVLFFPLPMAVRADTGRLFQDHREADFLVCHDGTWGILEVSFHQGRYEKDQEKDIWFKKSGVLYVQHYTAERCFNSPGKVVDEFLEILAKHKR